MADFHKGPKKGGAFKSSEDEDSPQVEAKSAPPPPEPEPEPIDQEALNESCRRSIANARLVARRRLLRNDKELLALFDKREAEKEKSRR